MVYSPYAEPLGWPPRPGSTAPAPSASNASAHAESTSDEHAGGGGDGLLWLIIVGIAAVIALVIGGVVIWLSTYGATAEARHLVFQEQVTQAQAGLSNYTRVRICNDFDSAIPSDSSISRRCRHLAPSSYAERIRFAFYNASTNTYKEVTVCGALIAQNDNGSGNLPEIARDNCEEFFNVAPGWTRKTVLVGGTLPWSTHVEIIDHTGFFTVNYHQVVGVRRPRDNPGARYCTSAAAIQPCG